MNLQIFFREEESRATKLYLSDNFSRWRVMVHHYRIIALSRFYSFHLPREREFFSILIFRLARNNRIISSFVGSEFDSHRFDKVFESISLHGKNGWPFRKRYTGNKISGMRCTSSNVLSLLSSSVLSNGVRFSPVSSYEAKDRDSIAERRCVNAAIPRTNHNPIITLISALSAMGLRDPNQPSYSTHFVHGTMIISFRFDPFSIGKVSIRSTPRFSAHNFM